MRAGRDLWWHDAVGGRSATCEPEWVDAEHPLFLRLKEREGVTIIGIAWKNKPEEARAWLSERERQGTLLAAKIFAGLFFAHEAWGHG